jgi:outer membrane protein assembly factor BamB
MTATSAAGTRRTLRAPLATAVVALLVALAAGLVAAAPGHGAGDAWPVDRHDAQRTGRSAVPASDRPLLRPGWPVVNTFGPVRVTPNGTLTLQPGGEAREAVIGRDGLYRRLGPARNVRAIGPDGRRYSFGDEQGNTVVARAPDGTLLWVSESVHLGESASDRTIVPSPGGGVHKTGSYGVASFDDRGRVIWQDGFGFENTGALAVGPDGTAYYGFEGASPAHRVVARRRDGTLLWSRPMAGRVNAVALAGDRLVVSQDRSSALGGAGVIALAAADGTSLWEVTTGLNAPAPPAIGADGVAYVVAGGTLMAIEPAGALRFHRRGPFTGAPVVGGDGTIYVGGAPATAVRPDGSVAWRLPSRVLAVPETIGSDGALYLRTQPGVTLALAPPGASGRVIPAPPARPLISGLRAASREFRVRGGVSLCPRGAGTCRPAAPLGTAISFRLSRSAVVGLLVRRPGSERVVARLNVRAPAGTSWRAATDLFPRTLPAGRYLLSARAAHGTQRVVSGPVSVRVVR